MGGSLFGDGGGGDNGAVARAEERAKKAEKERDKLQVRRKSKSRNSHYSGRGLFAFQDKVTGKKQHLGG